MEANESKNHNITNKWLKKLKNRNIMVFMLFVLLAAFLWFLNAVNKEYETELKVAYKFDNLPENVTPSNKNNGELSVLVHSHGYNLLKEKFERIKIPVVIDMGKNSQVKMHRDIIANKSYILTADLVPILTRRYSENIKVMGCKPDTLFFTLSEIYSKKVPITAKYNYSLESEYLLNGEISITPDSVTIFASKSIIDTITAANTVFAELGKIGNNNIRELKLSYIEDVTYSRFKVLINIPAEKYTETRTEVKINAINFPTDLSYMLIPDKMEIYYKVPLSLYEKIDSTNFEIIADFSSRNNDVIFPQIRSLNPYILITKTNHNTINYILERQAEND